MEWFLRADDKISQVKFEEVFVECLIELCGAIYYTDGS